MTDEQYFYYSQSVTAVTDEISDGLTKDWLEMMGTWMDNPMPIPVKAWYPIQCDEGEPMSSVYSNPAPIVAIELPTKRNGT